jgi:hypothetical protein
MQFTTAALRQQFRPRGRALGWTAIRSSDAYSPGQYGDQICSQRCPNSWQTAESGVGTIHSSQGNLNRSCVAALGRAKARFTDPGRRHAICLLVSAIIALIGTDAFSNPAHKQDASHRRTAAKADNHKHRLATDASHWHKVAKADHHKHQSPAEAKRALDRESSCRAT